MNEGTLQRLLAAIEEGPHVQVSGRVKTVVGLSIKAHIPLSHIGSLVRIRRRLGPPLLAEVVGFQEDLATLLPLGAVHGLGPDDPIDLLQAPLSVCCGPGLRGRVVDGLGRTCDGGQPVAGQERPLQQPAQAPLTRAVIDQPLVTGIRAIDGLCTLGEGQRVGLFSGAGVGKSSLLWQIGRNTTADTVVLCLLGERGRELDELLAGQDGAARRRSVVVCATAEQSALVRMKAAYVATTIAEHFAAEGRQVLLLLDSLTRFARAAREVGLSAGELPVRRGYPPSVFAALPPLLERCGNRRGRQGSITAIYSVLVESDDMEDPIADELRGLLDGHIMLDRRLASAAHYPAIDVLRSLSRLMPRVTRDAHRASAGKVRDLLAYHEDRRDLVTLGAVRPGSDPKLDLALAQLDPVRAFLRQSPDEHSPFTQTVDRLVALSGWPQGKGAGTE